MISSGICSPAKRVLLYFWSHAFSTYGPSKIQNLPPFSARITVSNGSRNSYNFSSDADSKNFPIPSAVYMGWLSGEKQYFCSNCMSEFVRSSQIVTSIPLKAGTNSGIVPRCDLQQKEKQPRIFRSQAASLCRWWGSNPHVLLAQGILSFYPHLPSGVIQWYLVMSGSHCAKAKFTPQRIIFWNIHDFSMRFSSTLFFRFGPPKWKLEGCSGGMQGKTLLCLGTKRKESQG